MWVEMQYYLQRFTKLFLSYLPTPIPSTRMASQPTPRTVQMCIWCRVIQTGEGRAHPEFVSRRWL